MKYFYLAASSIILAYIGITIFIYFYQRNLLYHPSENNYLNDKITFEYILMPLKIKKCYYVQIMFLYFILLYSRPNPTKSSLLIFV